MRDGEDYGSQTQKLLLKILRESNHTTSDQRQRAQPRSTVSHSLQIIFIIKMLIIELLIASLRLRIYNSLKTERTIFTIKNYVNVKFSEDCWLLAPAEK